MIAAERGSSDGTIEHLFKNIPKPYLWGWLPVMESQWNGKQLATFRRLS